MFIHNFASFELFVIKVNNCKLKFGYMIQKLTFGNLKLNKKYFSIFPNSSFMLNFGHRCFFSHSESLSSHFSHDFLCFFIFKIIKLIIFLSLSKSFFFFFSLLLLLHNNFVSNNFLHDLSLR